jgi:ATP-dependent Lon protease
LKIRDIFEKLLTKPTRSDAMDTIEPETDINAMTTVPEELPLLPLKDTVVYPLTVYPLVIGKEKSIKLINEVTVGDKILGLTSQKRADIEVATLDDVYATGTMAPFCK